MMMMIPCGFKRVEYFLFMCLFCAKHLWWTLKFSLNLEDEAEVMNCTFLFHSSDTDIML